MPSLNRNEIGRRVFLKASVVTMALQACATLAVVRIPTHEGTLRVRISDHPELSKAGGAVLIEADRLDGRLVLINLDGARFRTLSAICSHLGCQIRVSRHNLQCPCHGSTFTFDGEAVRGPATRTLALFDTSSKDGWVEIQVAR